MCIRNNSLFALCFLGTLLIVNKEASAASVAAKKDGVQILSEAKKGANVLSELKKDEAIEAEDRSGMFWKVKTKGGKTGFVSVLNVQRLAEDDKGLQGAIREAALKARANNQDSDSTRARSAVMGVRGLDASDETAAVGQLRPDLKAVYRMEDRTLGKRRLEKLESLVQQEVENTMLSQTK